MNRRVFPQQSAGALAAAGAGTVAAMAAVDSAPVFQTANKRWQAAYDRCLEVLAGNCRVQPRFDRPVLIERSVHQGIWMECGPLPTATRRQPN